jgi:hypothetical protein
MLETVPPMNSGITPPNGPTSNTNPGLKQGEFPVYTAKISTRVVCGETLHCVAIFLRGRCGGPSWWVLLNVASTATEEQIKERFKQLAKSGNGLL